METQQLQAQIRKETGKGVAHKLRARGMMPAIFYGPGTEPTPLALDPHRLLKALSTEHGRNTLINLKLGEDGREELALVKDLDTDPVSRFPRHVDLLRVQLDRPVHVEVPFRTRGRAVGVQKGGTLHVTLRTLPVRSTPDKIPAQIEVDVTKLEINDIVRVQDLPLPEGVTVLRAPQQTLVTIMSEERRGH